MAEITVNGVTGTTLLEYEDLVQAGYLSIDANWNITPESPDGQQIAIWSESLALLDEQVQYAYMSRDPSTAVGQALNDIADYAGIERQDATFSTSVVELTGVNGTLVPAGSRVRNSETGTLWALDSAASISGTTSVNVTATTAGALTASIGTLTEIADPVAGWQSVTNATPALQGQDEESDNAFRLRRNQSVSLPGANQVDNIFCVVANVDGVVQARVYENSTSSSAVSTANPNGLDSHSIAIFVQGGGVADIQSAIATKKNPGCSMNRDFGIPNENTATTTTPLGNPLSITFFRPDLITIFVNIEIETSQLSELEKAEIADAVVDFSLNGLTGLGDGFTRRGFQIGERIGAGRLYTPVNEIVADRGITNSITVGTTASPTGTSVLIAYNELAVFDTANIVVEYV